MRNIEIKARLREIEHVRQYMRQKGTHHEIQHQRDVFFHCSHGRLKLRCFPDGTGVVVAYERPDQSGPKLSDYTLAHAQDAGNMENALTRALGMRGVVEKTREIALIGQTRIHLDTVKDLGNFLELEVVMRRGQDEQEGLAIANDLMKDLHIAEADLLDKAYMDMLEKR
ncbi:MAG TPA: class IV adenylate cyclase [Terriglobales bacterium]